MNEKYDHKEIEKKWQEKWQEDNLYKSQNDFDKTKPKSYVLDMFPYPSGEGLHVGHPKGYIATDIYSRMKKMQGYNILHPMGWDAFGLPAENFAIKNKVHPRVAVEKNIKRFKEQLSKIGFNYDWNREINTTDPEYYKWTQWIFLKMFEKGLAYESYEPINWCPSCQTGLANEDLESDGTCERCGSLVEKRPMRQWVLRITDYADRMLNDLTKLNWPDSIKEAQRNWIGRSEGTELSFELRDKSLEGEIKVFTTRADTLFGATYLVVAPENQWLQQEILNPKSEITNKSEIQKYINEAKARTEIERTDAKKEKTGVEIKGIKAVNPANGEEVPVFVADYVLGNYGTGAVMAVPAHDDRDFEFAKKYELPINEVISGGNISSNAYTDEGTLINSGEFDEMKSEEAREKIAEKFGEKVTKYKLRDWVFSRQRYWGEPIPLVHCEKCGKVGVPEKDLPVRLPDVEHYEPTGTGESPLANISEWVNTVCPKCGGPAKRETNTMPQWAGSSWYYLRFIDPHNGKNLVDPKKEEYWAPVDVYVGGDHAVRHLIYARFWHKFLYDIGEVSTEEPFARLEFLGFILAKDGRKMGKRWGNVINPDDIVNVWGADTLRLYEMFMGPFENTIAWNEDNLIGVRRFIERVWRFTEKIKDENVPAIENILHRTIKKIGEDIESFKFNTAISQLMIFLNTAEKEGGIGKSQFQEFLKLLSPFAPHMTEEIWSHFGHTKSIHLEEWPKFDESKIKEENANIVVQINGKIRAQFETSIGISKDETKEKALALPDVIKWLEGKEIKKVIFVPNKIVNFVV